MELSPRGIVRQAVQKHCRSIALTYNEPTVFWPFGRDIFRAARREGLRTVMVSNGMMTEETARDMASLTDAVNIDLKAFTPAAVRFLGGGLPTVLQNLSVFMSAGVHVEVTTLAVPGLSDSPEELHEHLPLLRQYIPHSVPWHLSRFFPAGDWCNSAPTDTEVLHAMRRVLLQDGYQYVYRGNVAETEDTLCPRCGSHVIDRSSGAVFLPDGVCQQCGNSITGRFS
jgi:pyruvate formate lyase activating enzyme